MEVRKITQEDIPELIRFGEEAFPDRKEEYANIIHFVMDNRIGDYTGGVILVDDDGKIVGQSLHTSVDLWFENEKINSGWGYELIVEEKLRNDAWGLEIMLGSRRLFPGTCATGSNPTALKLNQKLGCKLIGEIRKYIIPSSIFKLPFNFLPSKNTFPSSVNDFKLIKDVNLIKTCEFFNSNLIEANRDLDFLNWRYFTPGFKKYYFYQNKKGDWFVVRPLKYKKIGILLISDFRCSLNDINDFDQIFKTVRKLANKMRIPFILCGSSHKIVDKVLENFHARSVGRPRPIIVSKELKKWINEDKVKERDFSFITFGDSDGEWNW